MSRKSQIEYKVVNNIKFRRCSKCSELKPLNEFNKSKKSPDGLDYWCKDCKKQVRIKWYLDNPQYNKQYGEEHKDELTEKNKQYRKEHKNELAEKKKQWYKSNKKERSKYFKQWSNSLRGYCWACRYNNLREDIKHGRIAPNEDPLPPLEYYMEKFSEGIDFYDGKRYPFNKLGFDRIDNTLPHIIENIVVCTTEHNKQRGNKPFEEFMKMFDNEYETN